MNLVRNPLKIIALFACLAAFAVPANAAGQLAMSHQEADESAAREEAAKEESAKDSKKEVEYSDKVKADLAKRSLSLGEPVDRIRHTRISGWNRIDNQHLLLTVGVSDKYLMRLIRYCQGLDDNATVQFSTVGSDVTSQDQVRVRGGPGRDVCQIQEIRELDRVEDAEKAEDEAE